jgi:type III pantothenate kinase
MILPGLRIAMEALEQNTARLPTVEIVPPRDVVGRSTIESIQSGLYFGTRAMVVGLMREVRKAAFDGDAAVVLGTGGFARLFEREKMFDALVPELVLVGLERALEMNPEGSRRWSREEIPGEP